MSSTSPTLCATRPRHSTTALSSRSNLSIWTCYRFIIALMLVFPPVLWAMLRRPNLTLAASFLLYLAARHFSWNLSAYPIGSWYFNPFCWQLLFILGGWFALGGSIESRPLIRSRALLVLGSAYLVFALVMTMAGRFPELAHMMPAWLVDAFNPNDKTNLAPYRLLHLIILAFFITRFMPRDWSGLHWMVFRPLIKCGQQSLEVFCFGVFLAVSAHVALVEVSNDIWMQISGQRRRYRTNDTARLLRLLVQGCRQVACEGFRKHSAGAAANRCAQRLRAKLSQRSVTEVLLIELFPWDVPMFLPKSAAPTNGLPSKLQTEH